MKSTTKHLYTTALLCALLVTASVAFAQEDDGVSVEMETELVTTSENSAGSESGSTEPNSEASTANRVEIEAAAEARQTEREATAADRQEQIAGQRVEMEANLEQHRAALAERSQERITNLAANMSNRMESIIARMQNIINRMHERYSKLAAQGVDITEATAALDSAQISLDAAATQIANIDVSVNAAVTSEDARAGWEIVRVDYLAIRDLIRSTHTDLRASLAAAKVAIAAQQAQPEASETGANPETTE